MAILVEQEKKPVNVMGILMGLTVAAALFLGAYIFLFKRPDVIDVVVPGNLKDLSQISNVPFEPEKVLQSEKLRVLKNYDGSVPALEVGRSNPFLP